MNRAQKFLASQGLTGVTPPRYIRHETPKSTESTPVHSPEPQPTETRCSRWAHDGEAGYYGDEEA